MEYKFGKFKFEQKKINFEEFNIIKDIVSDVVGNDIGELNIADIVDKLYESGKLKDIFNIMLKPKYSLVDKILFRKFDGNYYRIMTMEDIAGVISDFFALNFSWLGNLGSIVKDLELSKN